MTELRDTREVAIRFADVTIDVDAHELRRSGDLVDVQSQVLAVLVHLIRARDRVVPREELLDTIWQHRFVTESALTSRIKSARQAIGDNGRDQRMIRTVHGKGYRFVAEIDESGDSPQSSPAHSEPRPTASPVHLPAQSTPFVGREDEVREVIALLRDPDCRLLTIVAPGGMGKTRLAVAVAEALATEPADGVWFVPLAPVRDASEMVYVVADALTLPVDSGNDPVSQLLAHVATKRMLVVLDNLEQIDDVDLVSALVAAGRDLRVLVTSRERLHLQAEWIFELGGMGASRPDARSDAGSGDGSIELFVGAARRLDPAFEARCDDAAHAAIRRICRNLGGMPLAIELAAGWTPMLSLDDIADELESGFDLLETDLRDVPDRHRSIRTVVDGSWERLTPEERDVFMRLSVFRDGASRVAAEAVAGARLPVMRRLVGASMVNASHDDRWTVHELLRQYGEMRLVESGLVGETRDRHSAYFLAWIADRAVDLRGGAQREAVEDIAVDFANLRAAWGAAVEGGRIDEVAQATEPLWLYADTRGGAGEVGTLLRQALDAAEQIVPAGVGPGTPRESQVGSMALLRCATGWTLAQRGMLETGRSMLERGVADLTSETRDSKLALGHLWHGWVSFLLARNAEAAEHAHEAIVGFAAHGDLWGVARCQFLIGNNDTAVGQLVTADDALRTSLEMAEKIGDRRGVALACRNLCILAGWFGRYDEARSLIDRARALSREFDDRLGSAYALRELGKVLTIEGCTADAIETLQRSIGITDDVDNRWESAATADDLGNAFAAAGDFDAAEEEIRRCLRAAESSGHRYFVARCIGDLGALALRRGDVSRAEEHLGEALRRWEAMGHEPYASWVLVQLGHAAAAAGRWDDANRRYADALVLALRHGLAPFALDAIVGAAQVGVPAEDADRSTLLDLVLRHPAASHETRESARIRIDRLSDGAGDANGPMWDGAVRFDTWSEAARVVVARLAPDGANRDDG